MRFGGGGETESGTVTEDQEPCGAAGAFCAVFSPSISLFFFFFSFQSRGGRVDPEKAERVPIAFPDVILLNTIPDRLAYYHQFPIHCEMLTPYTHVVYRPKPAFPTNDI